MASSTVCVVDFGGSRTRRVWSLQSVRRALLQFEQGLPVVFISHFTLLFVSLMRSQLQCARVAEVPLMTCDTSTIGRFYLCQRPTGGIRSRLEPTYSKVQQSLKDYWNVHLQGLVARRWLRFLWSCEAAVDVQFQRKRPDCHNRHPDRWGRARGIPPIVSRDPLS